LKELQTFAGALSSKRPPTCVTFRGMIGLLYFVGCWCSDI